jgi:hypothetical protein
MKLNRKKLNNILQQIKAHLNVVVMMDNPEYPGLIDFLFQPKAKETELGYLNKLTCSLDSGDDLFADTVMETLGKPLAVDIARCRDALKGGGSEPELKDGVVNGINIQVDTDNLRITSMRKFINANWGSLKEFDFSGSVKFIMPRIDYELMVTTVTRFVSQDVTRISMCGYDIDFSKGEDFINFVATDGRKLVVCKFPCTHPKMGDDEGGGGDFIFNPLHLFIPESAYSRVQFLVNENASLIRIQTENYSIDCWTKSIGQFPNYLRVIPDKGQNKEWMSLNARSARLAFDSIKGLISNSGYSSIKNQVFFDAEDPKHIKLTIPDASVDIDGEASRPMRLRIDWDHINPGFFNTPFTKFFLQNINTAILAEETRAVRGTTMTLTKIIMPINHEEYVDEWGIEKSNQTKMSNDNSSKDLDSEGSKNDDDSIEYGDSLNGDT